MECTYVCNMGAVHSTDGQIFACITARTSLKPD